MNSLLLLGLALLGSCCALQPGFEYQYRYSGHVASGIPEIQNQFAAAGVEADVILQVINPTTIKAKLVNFQAGTLNEVLKGSVRDPLAIPYFPVQKDAAYLAQPFAINVAGGEIASLEVNAGEPVWVTNIRRSVVNTLSVEHLKASLNAQNPFADGPFFVLKRENSLFGKCATIYTLNDLPEDLAAKEAFLSRNTITQDAQATAVGAQALGTQYLAIKKTVDFDLCDKKVQLKRDGTPVNCKPGELMCEPKIDRSSIGSYVVRGDANGIRIERAVVEGSVIFHAIEANSERIQTFTKQELVLGAVRTIGQEMSLKTPIKTVDSFHFEFKPAPQGEDGAVRQPLLEEFASAIELEPRDFVAAKAGIVKTIKELVAFVSTKPTTNSVHEEHALHLHVAGKAVSLLTKAGLQEIHNEIAQSGSPDIDSVPMKTFAQLLMISGSEPAVRYLMELIETAPAAKGKALLLDFTTSILDIRSPAVIKPIGEFIMNKLSMANDGVYKSAALINFATVFQRLCVKPKTTFVHTTGCDAEALLGIFVPAIAKEFELETEGWKQIAYVQALNNLGTHKVWEYLKPIALGKATTDSRVRIHALWGFTGRIADNKVKWEAIQLLLSIFENYNNNYEVRSQAFLVLLTWEPSQAFLHQVAVSTWREPSNQVAALITHTLTTLANPNDNPFQAHRHIGKIAARVLPLAKPAPVTSIVTSFYKNMVTFMSKTTPVAWNQFAMIANTNGVFPRHLSIMMHNCFLDANKFSVYMDTHVVGADEIFKHVAAFIKMRFADASIQRGAMMLAKELYAQIKENVGAQMKATPKKMEIFIMTKFFRTYQILLPVIADLDTLIENPMSVLAKLKERKHFQLQMFKEPVVLETAFPTELGLPHLIQLATPTINYIVGSIQLIIPGAAEGRIDAIKFDIDLTIVQNNKLQVLAKTALPWARTAAAVGIDHVKAITLPIAANVLVDLKESKMQFTVKPVGDKVELLGVRNVPFTGIIGALPMLPIEGFEIKPVQALQTPFYTNKGVLAEMGLAAKYVWEGDFQNQLALGNLFTKLTSMGPHFTTSAIIPNTAKFWSMKIFLDVTASANKAIDFTIAYVSVDKLSSSSITVLNQYPQALKVNKIQQNYQAIPAGRIHSIHAAVEFVGAASTRYEAVMSMRPADISAATTAATSFQVSLIKGEATAVCFNIDAVTPMMLPLTHYESAVTGDFKTTLKFAASKGANCQGTPPVAKINAEFFLGEPTKKMFMAHFKTQSHRLIADNIVERVLAPFQLYDQYKATATWTDALPTEVYTPAYMAWDAIIALVFPNIYRTYEVNPANQITLVGHKNVQTDSWRTVIKAPKLTAFWEHAWAPVMVWASQVTGRSLAPISTLPVYAIQGYKGLVDALPVACSIYKLNIETFDGVSFPITPTGCWSVAAMSLVNDPMPFAVQVKTKGVHTARIVLPAENVVIQATATQEVQVNGKPVAIGEVKTVLSELSYAYKVAGGILIKAGNGVAVKVTDAHVHISAPSLYRGQVGGLCGDNNGEATSDLVGPTGCVYNKAAYFAAAWAVPEGGCDAGVVEVLKAEVKGFQATCPRHHVISSYPSF